MHVHAHPLACPHACASQRPREHRSFQIVHFQIVQLLPPTATRPHHPEFSSAFTALASITVILPGGHEGVSDPI